MPSDTCEDIFVAYHEAGHTVVSRVLGCNLATVTIENGGLCLQEGDNGYMGELLFALAGDVAESRFGDNEAKHRCDQEYARSMAEGVCCTSDDNSVDELLEDARGLVTTIIDEQWPTVADLAAALRERRTLEGAEVAKIVDSQISKETKGRYRGLRGKLFRAHKPSA